MNKFRKILAIFFDILGVSFFAGAYVIHYFAERKLGMVRWLNYHTMSFKKFLPLEELKLLVFALIAILLIILVIKMVKSRKHLKTIDIIFVILMFIGFAFYAWALFSLNQKITPDYYYLVALMSFGTISLQLRNFICIFD